MPFERSCPDYLVCGLCGLYAHHCGGGNYECLERHRFSESEKNFGRYARLVPGGWVAVHAEPTGEMLARLRLSDAWTTEALTARYKDMLRVTPRAAYAPLTAELQNYRKYNKRKKMRRLLDGVPHDGTFNRKYP